MSFLRYASPGQTTRLIDQGSAVGRTGHSRKLGGNRSIIAGSLVQGESGNAQQRAHAEAKKRRRLRQREEVLAAQLEGRS